MTHPYAGLPDYAFWRRSVGDDTDPVVDSPFRVGPETKIATAGSCFAQHISRMLTEQGYRYLVTEPEGEDAGVFPARFGNIYTPRQLLQTFDRAYAVFRPAEQMRGRKGSTKAPSSRRQATSAGRNTA